MDEVDELRYRALHEPFGVDRDDDWGDRDPAAVHVVALLAGRVVGYVRVDIEAAVGVVKQLSVAEDVRRAGIGSALMGALIELARERGLDRLTLDARLNAEPLYAKLGFRRISAEFRAPRTYLPHVRMVLDL